jgi:hypothetical protein
MASKGNKNTDIQAPSVNWLEQLAAELNVPFAPKGWHTMAQICERVGRDHQIVRKMLKRANAQTAKYRHLNSCGKVIVTVHYKI